MYSRIRSVVCAALAVTSMTAAGAFSTVSAEWYKTKEGISYTDENGTVKGWQNIGGARYYFGKDGYAVTGFRKIGGKTYFFAKDGKMKTGKVKINGKTYDFGKDGVLKSAKGTKMVVKKAETQPAKKAAQTDDTGIKWGADAEGMRDWRMDAVSIGKEGSDTLFFVREEPLETTVFSVNDKLGLYKVAESGIARTFKDECCLLTDKGYELWFETTVDNHTVYVYKKAGVVVFTAGVLDEAKNPPGNATYKTVTISPAYAKTLDESKAKALAKKEFENVFYDRIVKKTQGTASVKEPTSRYMVAWNMSAEDLEKRVEAEKKQGREGGTDTGISDTYYIKFDDSTVMLYSVDETRGVFMQSRFTLGRSFETEKAELKSMGFSAWKTYKKKDGTVYAYKSDKYAAMAMQIEADGLNITAVGYFSQDISETAIELGDDGAKALADYFCDIVKKL